MSQAQNGKRSASLPSLPRLQPPRATKPYANTSATPTALAAAKRAKHHAHKAMPEKQSSRLHQRPTAFFGKSQKTVFGNSRNRWLKHQPKFNQPKFGCVLTAPNVGTLTH